MVDVQGLDPGIVETVRRLRANGFDTTDSGDGVSKPSSLDVLPFPHVHCRIDLASDGLEEACRLNESLPPPLRKTPGGECVVQMTYFPEDGITVLSLLYVDDAALAAGEWRKEE